MTTRRLAAILAADVVGFSTMMERDEESTAERIRKLRAEVVTPTLDRHHGRLVKTTGDGFLAEFASPSRRSGQR
jgi:adenylate cyclase